MPVPSLNSVGPVEKYLRTSTRSAPICAALIDPEDFSPRNAGETAAKATKCGANIILVGGSTLSNQTRLDSVVRAVQSHVTSPVILFPGNVTGVSRYADAILFSSLLNSTNPYFIIGAQALGAMEVHKTRIESIPMGYLVFGNSSATSFIGQANGLPISKPNLAVIYALAAQFLGMRTLYLEAGSGASEPIPTEIIHAVRKFYGGLLFVGGGITSAEAAFRTKKGGADIVVVGNLLRSPGFEVTLEKIISVLRNG